MLETSTSVREFKARQIVSHDADEQAATLCGWKQTYDQLTPGPFVGSLTELNFSATHLFCETTSHKLHQLCEIPDGAWWFGIPVGRDAAGSIHATPISTEVLAFRPGGCEFELLTPPDYSILGLVVNADALMRYAEQYCESTLRQIHTSNEIICIGAQRRHALSEMLQMILREGRSAADASGAPRSTTWKRRYSPRWSSPVCCRRRARRPAISRARVGSRSLPMPVTSRWPTGTGRSASWSFAACCVSRRTLQYCFEYAYDTTPQNYLRALRLNGVRRAVRARARFDHHPSGRLILGLAHEPVCPGLSDAVRRAAFRHPARGRRQRGLSRLAPHRIAGMAAARAARAPSAMAIALDSPRSWLTSRGRFFAKSRYGLRDALITMDASKGRDAIRPSRSMSLYRSSNSGDVNRGHAG